MKNVTKRESTKPDCARIQNELAAYHHRELSILARAAVRWHLALCPACRKEIKTVEQVGATLEKVETSTHVALDGALRAKILSNLPEPNVPCALAAQPLPSQPFARRTPLVAWGVLAATACVAAAVFFPTFSRSRENARRASTQSNMKQIGLGFAQYAQDNKSTDSTADSFGRLRQSSNAVSAQERIATFKSARPSAAPESATRILDGSDFRSTDGHVKWSRPQEQKLSQNRLAVSWKRLKAGEESTPLTPYRRVHKEGSLAVAVEKLEASSDAVESTIKKAGGFVANNTLSTEKDGLKSAVLEIRVPVGQFETVIKQIAALGDVKAKRIEGEDITAQVSDANEENNVFANDLRIRLDQYRKAKERAARKNKGVPDDWQRRAEIRQMRVQLAQVRARIELLKKQSDFAALSVELREQSPIVSGGGFLSDVGNTSHAAYDSFVMAARLPVNLLIYILVYSPFWLPILIAWRYFTRPNPRRLPEP